MRLVNSEIRPVVLRLRLTMTLTLNSILLLIHLMPESMSLRVLLTNTTFFQLELSYLILVIQGVYHLSGMSVTVLLVLLTFVLSSLWEMELDVADGCFIKGALGTANKTENWPNSATQMFFDASHSNPIYGRSNTVQPPAVVVYFIQKISA